jgi:hypothetical protein
MTLNSLYYYIFDLVKNYKWVKKTLLGEIYKLFLCVLDIEKKLINEWDIFLPESNDIAFF